MRRRRWLTNTMVYVVIVVALYMFFVHPAAKAVRIVALPLPKVEPPIVVITKRVHYADVPVHGMGTVMALTTAVVRSPVTGKVHRVYFREGTDIATHAPLFDVDVPEGRPARIEAPVFGRTGLSTAGMGDTVQADAALVTITRLRPITVVFSIPADALPQVQKRFKKGEVLPVVALDGEGRPLSLGKLVAIDNAVENDSVSVRAEFDNITETLLPNLRVEAQFKTVLSAKKILLPEAAIQHTETKPTVYLVVTNAGVSTLLERVVVLGENKRGLVSILGGVVPGDCVVVADTAGLRANSVVSPKERSPDGVADTRRHCSPTPLFLP